MVGVLWIEIVFSSNPTARNVYLNEKCFYKKILFIVQKDVARLKW